MNIYVPLRKISDQPASAGEVVYDHQEKIRNMPIEELAKYIRAYKPAVKKVGYSQGEVDDYLKRFAGNIKEYVSGKMSIDKIDVAPDFTEEEHGYSKKETNSLIKSLQAKLQQAKQEQMRAEAERRRKEAEEAVRKRIAEKFGPNATFLDEITAITIEGIAAEQEREKQEEAKKQEKLNQIERQLTPILPRLWPDIDNAIRERAKAGKTSIEIYPEKVDGSKKSMELDDSCYSGRLHIRMLPRDADSDYETVAHKLIIKHYEDEGFTKGYVNIEWPSEDKETIEAREAKEKAEWEAEQLLLAARIASVQSAKIISSFISVEGSNGNMTNYIMHTVRLTYKDGKKDLISIRESDPFFQGIIEKLEN